MSFLSGKVIQAELRSGPRQIGPVTVSVVAENPVAKVAKDSFQADLLLQITYGDNSVRFIAEAKSTSSRSAVYDACVQAIKQSAGYDAPPLIIVPYLDEEQLMEINDQFPPVSAIDLCGNALIKVPGKLFIFSSGKPNNFPDSRSIKNIYQGTSALVARLLLAQPHQKSVTAVQNQIEKLGGKISLSAVSKVMTQLKDELLVVNKNSELRIHDPFTLLSNLLRNYSAPAAIRDIGIKLKGPLVSQESIPGILSAAALKLKYRFCVSGASSFPCYGVGAIEPMMTFYCSGDITEVLNYACETGEISWEEEDIFPNARIVQTEDPSVFFDCRPYMNALAASPIQCYLELKKGDKRQQDGAEQVKKFILQELEDFIEESKVV